MLKCLLLFRTYTITENLPAGWGLTAIDIYDPSNNSSGTSSNRVSKINVAAGEVVHVNYTNAFINVTNTSTSCGEIWYRILVAVQQHSDLH